MNDDKQILSTNLSIDDYNTFLTLTKLEYQAGLIKEESISELLRFTIRHILNQLGNDQIYRYLEQEQGQQQESPIIDSNITTIMEDITNVTTTTSPESIPSISTSPSVPLSPSIDDQREEDEDSTIYWDIE